MGEARRKQQRAEQQGIALVPTTRKGPKRISADDAAYLRKVRAGLQQAAQLEQEAAQLEQRAAQLRQQAVARYGAHESWVDHLCERYDLDKDTDNIDHDTMLITRAPVLEAATDGQAAPPTTSLRPKREARDEARTDGGEPAAPAEA